jgi:hypothetical protein
MTTRIYVTTQTLDGEPKITRIEPARPTSLKVMVRGAESFIPFDGVWIDGERSYDTNVIVDGWTQYRSPARHIAEQSFDLHEAAGGGHPLP